MEEEEQQQPQDPERLSRRDKEIRKFTRHSYVRLIIAQHVRRPALPYRPIQAPGGRGGLA